MCTKKCITLKCASRVFASHSNHSKKYIYLSRKQVEKKSHSEQRQIKKLEGKNQTNQNAGKNNES